MKILEKKIQLVALALLSTKQIVGTFEEEVIKNLARYPTLTPQVEQSLFKLADHTLTTKEQVMSVGSEKNLLFTLFPTLRTTLSYLHVADLPTPIHECTQLNRQWDLRLFVKQDGLSAPVDEQGRRLFGGNKVRKLQYLLADALAKHCSTVVTFGAAGSNHALQTAIFAQRVGLKCITMLVPQPNSPVVRQNLLLQKAFDAQIRYSPDRPLHALATAATFLQRKQEDGTFPYFIPVGGSCARGSIGFVQAVLELQEQVQQGAMPLPDHLYVTLGSAGTAAGLLVGLKLTGMRTKLHFVLDEPEAVSGTMEQKLLKLAAETVDLLRSLDPAFPALVISQNDYLINSSACGVGYGLATQECEAAMQLMHEQEGITLDPTYTGKCFAALCADAQAKRISGTVLFWNTFCGEDMSSFTNTVDYRSLPKALHQYFE